MDWRDGDTHADCSPRSIDPSVTTGDGDSLAVAQNGGVETWRWRVMLHCSPRRVDMETWHVEGFAGTREDAKRLAEQAYRGIYALRGINLGELRNRCP